MKRIISILVTVLLFCGCSNGININNNSKELKINLYSNSSTGYEWTYKVSNEDIINISKSYKTNCPSDVAGCGGENVYTIKPLKEGKVTITFKYARSWESSEYDLEAIYEIVVDKGLNITETHKGTYFEEK